MTAASWSAERLGDADGPLVAVFVHGGFWRARYAADTIAPLAEVCAADDPHPWVWNLEYPRVGMAGGGWPGTARAVRDGVGAAVDAAAGRPVVVIGHSAGGHLALWAAREYHIAAVVSLAGVCDLRAAVGLSDGAVRDFAGGEPDDAFFAAASPVERLPLGVPALLIHGDADENVPIAQSRSYAAAARAAGDECELVELPGAEHFEVVNPAGRAWPRLRARLEALAGGS
ncbi:MAG TPA: prolyl oligopeptidase family serine peptidase [Solirubrobacteraceae bacterium]|nr:prolyl oligopeptidase family serine peptidase [Solirubrobacteraceae bacterium]